MGSRIKVLVIDDIVECAQHYKNLVSSNEQMEVVGIAHSGEDAVNMSKELKPDIILMDVQLETPDAGIKATEEITEFNPETKVIILTAFYDEDIITDAYVAGAVEYFVKDMNNDDVIQTILNIYNNESFIGNVLIQNSKKQLIKNRDINKSFLYALRCVSLLSKTEYKILMMLLEACPRKDIMEDLNITLATFKSHINKILKKLEYPNVSAMIKDIKYLNVDVVLKEYIKK